MHYASATTPICFFIKHFKSSKVLCRLRNILGGECNRIGSISQSCRCMRQMSRLYGDEYRLKQLLSIHIAL